MKQMVPSLIAIAKKELTAAEANRVEKAIKYNDAAPFSVSDLHALFTNLQTCQVRETYSSFG